MDFRIVGTRLEGAEEGEEGLGQSLAFGPIPSGKAAHLALNFSVDSRERTNKLALFRNFSALVSVNEGGSFLPSGQFDQRFFLIQDIARRDHSMLVVSEHSSPFPLYLFSKRESALTPLMTLQLIEEKEARPVLNGHQFLSRAFALRRLAISPTPTGSNDSAHPASAVLATLSVDTAQTFGNGAKLLRVSELGPQGRQRPLDMGLVWVGQSSNEKTTLINFVDTNASPAIPQLIYELLFGRPEQFRAPFFPQPFYQLHLASPVVPVGQQVLARLAAVSPQNRQLNYSLWSTEEKIPFSIVPSTGDLVLNQPLPAQSEFCLNLGVTDSEGHSATRVPLQISVVGMDTAAGSNCQLYAEGTPLYSHEFKPEEPKQLEEVNNGEQHLLLITLPSSTGGAGWKEVPAEMEEEEGDDGRAQEASNYHRYSTLSLSTPSTTTTGLIVEEFGGDSTLSPLTTASAPLAIADGDESGYEINGNGSSEGSTSPASVPAASSTTTSFVSSSEERSPFGGTFQTPVTRFATAQPQGARPTTASSSIQIAGVGGVPRPRPGQHGTGVHREGKEDVTSASANSMAEMACRLRTTKPIWALICDMAKTAYRTTLLQNV